jgi:hypothetical protein
MSPPNPSLSSTTVPVPVTVIELFQSQGANSFLVSLASQPNFGAENLILTYEVTYWDQLGWRDTFGDAQWDARQTAYARALRQRSCYTPQVIVDGGAKPMGGSWRNLTAVLANGKPNGELRFGLKDKGRVLSVAGSNGRGLVLAVFYESEPEPVRILRGENRGVTERYRNVVRDMQLLGTWEGGEVAVELPPRRNGLEIAVLVQAGNGGPILGAVRV